MNVFKMGKDSHGKMHSEMYVSQITTGMFHLSYSVPGPFLIHDLSSGL